MASTEGHENGNKDVNVKRSKADWNDKNLDMFIKACITQVRAGNRPHTHFNKVGWNNVITDFNKQSGLSYGYKQLKNKWDLLRGDWKLWAKLVGKETGLGWDNLRQTIAASEEWWTAKIKECPGLTSSNIKVYEICLIWRSYLRMLWQLDIMHGHHLRIKEMKGEELKSIVYWIHK